MHSEKTLLLTLAGTVMFGVSCSRGDRSLEERFQGAMEGRLRQYDVKGASAAVVLPDSRLLLATAGISHDRVRMSPDMAFAVGSITKNMVAAMLLQLAEEGKLSLEDPISKWLPPYPHVEGTITIRQLLSHTSGLFMFWENQKIWDDLIKYREKQFSPEEVLGYLKAPHFAPGKGYHYSNTNYLLAAMIITRARGSTLSTEFRKRFWEPLGLTSARLALEEPYPENLAHVWGDNYEKDGSYRDITFLPRVSHDSITYGSAGVFMTAGDLATWTHALFHGKVINQQSLAKMQTFAGGAAYGLGLERFRRLTTGGMKAYGHGGGNIGTMAYMIYLPDHDVSIAVMVNHFGGDSASRMVRDIGKITVFHLKPLALFLSIWNVELWMSLAWLLFGVGAGIVGIRKKKPLVPILIGTLMIASGVISMVKGLELHVVLFPMGALLGALGLYLFIRRIQMPPPNPT